MHLAQVKLLIRAADKRDAEAHLHSMQDFHTAIAPLLVGDEGKEVMNERRAALRNIVLGKPPEKRKDKAFAQMWALANKEQPKS